MDNSKKSLLGIIFVSAFCSMGMMMFHYFCHSKGTFKLFFSTANSSWGYLFVMSFYSISGTVLYYNYSKIPSMKTFYFKSWKSIFPSYYMCFIYFFIKNVFKYHKLLYNGHWSSLIFTVFGMDGYLGYSFKTYYLVGEWFLGSMMVLYILYPLLAWMMNKNILMIHFMVLTFYPLMNLTNFFIMSNASNIITCFYSFYFGMLALKLHNLFFKNKITFMISFIILIFLCSMKMSKFILIYQMQSFSLFMVLVQMGESLMLTSFKIIFKEMSILSYNIFLFQHSIILEMLSVNNPTKWYLHLMLLGVTMILTILCAKILFMVINNIFKSY